MIADLKNLGQLTLQLLVQHHVEVVAGGREEAAQVRGQVVEEGSASLSKLDASRGCRASILLYLLLVIGFARAFSFDSFMFGLGGVDHLRKLTFECSCDLLRAHVGDCLAEGGGESGRLALPLLVPILVEELAADIAELEGRVEVIEDGLEDNFDLVD